MPTVPFHVLGGQFYIVTRHMLEVNWVPLVGATVITKKAWDTFSPGCRDALSKTAADAGEQMKMAGRAENNQAVEAMKKRGLEVHTITPEIEADWRKFAEQVYPRIRGSLVPADMFDEVRRLLVEYRAKNGKGTR